MSRTRAPWRASTLPGLLAGVLLVAGCGAPKTAPDGRVWPRAAYTDTRHVDTEIVIENPGARPLVIHDVRLEGDDWDGFVLTDETLPESIAAGGRALVHVRAHPRAFARPRKATSAVRGGPPMVSGGLPPVREGDARLVIRAGSPPREHSVALRFSHPPAGAHHLIAAALALLLSIGVWFGLIAIEVRSVARARARWAALFGGDRRHDATRMSALGTLAILAAIPFGAGLCTDADAWGGASALAMCRAGRGGIAAQAIGGDASGVLLLGGLAALAVSCRATASTKESGRWQELALGVIALVVLGRMALGGTSDTGAWFDALPGSASSLGFSWWPRAGASAFPLAAVACALAVRGCIDGGARAETQGNTHAQRSPGIAPLLAWITASLFVAPLPALWIADARTAVAVGAIAAVASAAALLAATPPRLDPRARWTAVALLLALQALTV